MSEINYAKRALQRKAGNHVGRKSTLTREQRLERQVTILADRLALALYVMNNHETLIKKSAVVDWMAHMEEWADQLTGEEPEPKPGHQRLFHFHRSTKLYRYFMNGIRGMLRKQIDNPPTIER